MPFDWTSFGVGLGTGGAFVALLAVGYVRYVLDMQRSAMNALWDAIAADEREHWVGDGEEGAGEGSADSGRTDAPTLPGTHSASRKNIHDRDQIDLEDLPRDTGDR